jgi:putative acetyltransferase
MSAIITSERPDTADAIVLIAELEAQLEPFYPRASRHGMSVERLLAEAVAFFVLRSQDTPAACGGVKLFDGYGELKRMYVREQFRGLGFGRMMLDHLAGYSHAQGITVLRLETGIHQHAAIAMYERAGFERIQPFGSYTDDPLSVFFEKQLTVVGSR